MRYLVIPFDHSLDKDAREAVLIAISNLKSSRGLRVNVVPEYWWIQRESQLQGVCG